MNHLIQKEKKEWLFMSQEPVINEEFTESKVSDLKLILRRDPEVLQLAEKIDPKDQIQLIGFGKEPAEEISKFADRILSNMRKSSIEKSSELIKQLGKIMDKFDSKDFTSEKQGFLQKMFSNAEKLIEKIFAKYQTMGQEIDKVYIEIKKYEQEMIESTKTFEEMSKQNYNYYKELEKYTVAMELKVDELKANVLPELEKKAETGDQMAGMELQSFKNALELLEQKVYSNTMAGHVAFQNEPNIRQLQRGNTKLVVKINDAFITTIPIFKTSIIQAVHAKRQKLVADSMSELDRRTNEMLLRNAENIANQGKEIARLAGGPSIKIETMEKTWQTIMQGIKDVQAIEEEVSRERESGIARLNQLQEEYKSFKAKS